MQSKNHLNSMTLSSGKSDKFENSTMVNNHLESLIVFSNLILHEIDNLRREENLPTNQKINLSEEVQNYEAKLIHSALLRCNGRQRTAAKLLGVKTTTLNSKIKRLGIELFSYKETLR